MESVFTKIIERLEEEVKGWLDLVSVDETVAYAEISACNKAIEIVNQVAEEYAEKEFSEWCHDCPAYDKENHHCPRLCKVIRTVVEEIKGENNSKWIPCSERLPEEFKNVLVTNTTGFICIAKRSGNSWYEDAGLGRVSVEAWQKLPAPYKPKGE